jgi:hypothetical protein
MLRPVDGYTENNAKFDQIVEVPRIGSFLQSMIFRASFKTLQTFFFFTWAVISGNMTDMSVRQGAGIVQRRQPALRMLNKTYHYRNAAAIAGLRQDRNKEKNDYQKRHKSGACQCSH